jgi:4-hydroxy-tetrahydrodipicolinate reductase
MARTIRVIQFGMGPIGCATAAQILERDSFELVGAVDIDPAKIGRDVSELIGLEEPVGLEVVGSLDDLPSETEADAALHTTNSYFPLFREQVEQLLRARLDIVSTSEELSFPWLANPEEASRLDELAKSVGKTVVGTGVNPGFLMDSLPLFLTSLSQRVDHVSIKRVINASLRRGPFQAKIGSGLTEVEFMDRMDSGRMGHVGLPESVGMIFETLGRKLVRYQSAVEPVIADSQIETDHFTVAPGFVRGLLQTASGYDERGEFVKLTFEAALDAGGDGDVIHIKGKPDLEVQLKGTNGDIATVAIAVNALSTAMDAVPGVMTMRDLPIVTWVP